MGLVVVQHLRFAKVGQIFMVGENLDWERRAVEIMSPGFESTDNSEEFSVIDVIIPFCWGKGLGEVQAGMPFAVGVGLEEDSA